MNLMYSFKCIDDKNNWYCHPCCGAYRIDTDPSDQRYVVVTDVKEGAHFSTKDYPAIYIENAGGTTIDRRLRVTS